MISPIASALDERLLAVTPRGAAVVTLIRANWLRAAPTQQASHRGLDGIIGPTPGLTADDRIFLTELLDAHREARP